MQAIMKESVDTTTGSLDNVNAAVGSKDMAEPPNVPKEDPKEEVSAPSGSGIAEDSEDLREVVKEIMYWHQPMLSGKIFFAVMMFYYATLEGGYDPVNLVCYLLIFRLVAVSGPQMVAKKFENSEKAGVKTVSKLFAKSGEYMQEFFQFPSSEQVSFVVSSVSATIESNACRAVEALRKAEKDTSMMKTVLLHLFGLMIATSIFSVWTLVFMGFFIMMTAPAIYSRHYETIDPVLDNAKAKVMPHVDKVKTKGGELYSKAKAKGEEVSAVLIQKYKERMAKNDNATPKETKTE